MDTIASIILLMLSNAKSRLVLRQVYNQRQDYILEGNTVLLSEFCFTRIKTEMGQSAVAINRLNKHIVLREVSDEELELALVRDEPTIMLIPEATFEHVKANIQSSNLDDLSKITCISLLECCGVYPNS